MNILQQIWNYSNVFLTFLVNLVHAVGLAVFDHDMVAVGETAQFFAVTSINGGQIAVFQNRLWQTAAVRRCRGWQFGRGRLKIEKPRACIPPTSGLEVLYKLRLARSFMQATASYGFPIYRDCIISIYLSNFLSQKMYR